MLILGSQDLSTHYIIDAFSLSVRARVLLYVLYYVWKQYISKCIDKSVHMETWQNLLLFVILHAKFKANIDI